MRFVPALVGLLALAPGSGCYFARADARIHRGLHVGAAANVQWTPEAEIFNNDADLVHRPELEDGANHRGQAEAQLGYGWRRVDLTLHLTFLDWTSPGEGGHEATSTGIAPVLDVYVLAHQDGPWSFGFGGELPLFKGYAVLTRELAAGTALSLTARVGPFDAQAQASFVVGGPRWSTALIVAGVAPLEGDEVDLRFCDSACQEVHSPPFVLFGLHLTAH
jgi:hypothetical protein